MPKKVVIRQDKHESSAFEPLSIKCLRCPGVLESICASATPRTTIRLRETCRMTANLVAAFNSLAFDINKFLEKLLPRPIEFRSLQARTGSIIAGSTALSFFARTWFPGDNINLFVNPGHEYEVARHLIDVQGFAYRPTGTVQAVDFVDGNNGNTPLSIEDNQLRGSIYAVRSVKIVHRFIRTDKEGHDVEILMMLTTRSALHAVLNAHSSKYAILLHPAAS